MKLSQLAAAIDATLIGDPDVEVHTCAPIATAGPDAVAFIANSKYAQHLATTRAAAVIVHPSIACPEHVCRLVSDDPYFAFRNAVIALHGFRQHPQPIDAHPPQPPQQSPDDAQTEPVSQISERAAVHPTARLGVGVQVHPFAVVEAGAVIGDRSVLYPGAYVGVDVQIGSDSVLYPNAVVYDRCVLGDRVAVHANTVIGQDGFGYATHNGVHHKIPQSGTVVVGNDVEFGAGCAIERAAIGETRIGDGTKFADLISIGHGTTIGQHCLLVSLVGVSGTVEIGDYVVLGGQVGVVGHLRIGDGVQAAGRSAIATDIPPGSKVGGAPAVELDQAKRNALAGRDLYGLSKRVRQLERRIEKMSQSTG